MFGIGIQELIVIACVALLFVGPKRLPELARQFGKLFVQARRATSDMRSAFDDVVKQAEDEIRKEEREAIQKLLTGRINLEEPAKTEPVIVTGEPEPHVKQVNKPAQSASDDVPTWDTDHYPHDHDHSDSKKPT